jgi:hypothetical protein
MPTVSKYQELKERKNDQKEHPGTVIAATMKNKSNNA